MCDLTEPTEYVEVVVPGSMEGDADKALAALKARTPAAAVRALRLAAQWHYGSEAGEALVRAADRIELRLKQGQPWRGTLRRVATELGPTLAAMSGREE